MSDSSIQNGSDVNMSRVSQIDLDDKKDSFEKFLTYRRRMARMCAVQALYLHDINSKVDVIDAMSNDLFGTDTDTNIMMLCYNVLYFYRNIFFIHDEYGSNRRNKRIDEKYMKEIVVITLQHINRIDELISIYLNDRWTIDRLDAVVRAILRCGVSEVLFNDKVDRPILTSEYTNIAGNFFSFKETGFVNGIIDRINKERAKVN